MTFNLHTSLVQIYDIIDKLPTDTGGGELTRPDNLFLPNGTVGDISKKPYWRVLFLGTQAGREAERKSTFSFLVQIDMVVKTGAQIKELNDFTELLWRCFPKGIDLGGAVVSQRPAIAELGEDATNSGYRRAMTISFRASTFSKATKGGS